MIQLYAISPFFNGPLGPMKFDNKFLLNQIKSRLDQKITLRLNISKTKRPNMTICQVAQTKIYVTDGPGCGVSMTEGVHSYPPCH